MILLAELALLSLMLRTGYDSIEPRHSMVFSFPSTLFAVRVSGPFACPQRDDTFGM
jgi:hypothetical protein